MSNDVNRIPDFGLLFAIEKLRNAIDFPFTILGQGCDGTPPRAIIRAEEGEFSVHGGNAKDSRDLHHGCNADQQPSDILESPIRVRGWKRLAHDDIPAGSSSSRGCANFSISTAGVVFAIENGMVRLPALATTNSASRPTPIICDPRTNKTIDK